VINYLHKMVIVMVQQCEETEKRVERIVIMKASVRVTWGGTETTTEMPLAVNGDVYWHGSGHGVCSPDFITCVNIDFRCCCYRRQVKCSSASCLRTGRCPEQSSIDGASHLTATLHW
jgi:hypothetical protein